MADTPLFVGSKRTEPFIFVPGFSTRPRILWTPGSSGSEIYGISVASSDNADPAAYLRGGGAR